MSSGPIRRPPPPPNTWLVVDECIKLPVGAFERVFLQFDREGWNEVFPNHHPIPESVQRVLISGSDGVRIRRGWWERSLPRQLLITHFLPPDAPLFPQTIRLDKLEWLYNRIRRSYPRMKKLFEQRDTYTPNYQLVEDEHGCVYAACDQQQQPTRCRLCAGSDWARKGVTHAVVRPVVRRGSLLEQLSVRGKCPGFVVTFEDSFVECVNDVWRSEDREVINV